MREEGQVDPGQISGARVPRELRRGWLMFIDKLGEGAFGEVWKGLLKDRDHAGPSRCTIPIPATPIVSVVRDTQYV